MFGLVGVIVGTVAGGAGSGASARALGKGAVGQIMTANTHAIRWATSVRDRPPDGYDDITRNTPGVEHDAEEDEATRHDATPCHTTPCPSARDGGFDGEP
jgi:hypothetical protein